MTEGAWIWRREQPEDIRTGYDVAGSGTGSGWKTGATIVSALGLLFLVSSYNFLLFHAVVEILGIVVAGGIFLIAWNARRFPGNSTIRFLGISTLFVGFFALLHLLYYKGMGVFPPGGPDVHQQLWIAGSSLQSLSFLAAVLLVRRNMSIGPVFAIFLIVTAAMSVSLLLWPNIPASPLADSGLATFRKISELAISGVLVSALAILTRVRREFEDDIFRSLAACMTAALGVQVLFLLSRNVFDLANFFGHVLQFFALLFLYRAVIAAALVKPQTDLSRNLERCKEARQEEDDLLRHYLDTAGVLIIVLNADQTVGLINSTARAVLGYTDDELLGRNWYDVVVPPAARDAAKAVFDRMFARKSAPEDDPTEQEVLTKKGESRTVVWRSSVLRDREEKAIALLCSGEDVTERHRVETDQELLIQDLRTALNRVKTLSGLLPICAACKKVRDDKGYWSQVETYVEQHSNAHFTHGICPDCAQRLYPELFKDGMPPE